MKREIVVVENPSMFELFGLDPCFKINLEELHHRYIALQKKYHPDQAVDKIGATNQAIKINQAFKILSNERTRAEYLLKVQGVVVNSDHDTVRLKDTELLEILELREKIDEESSPEKLDLMTQEITILKDGFFENFDHTLATDLDMAARAAIKARYFEKILEEIKTRKNAIT